MSQYNKLMATMTSSGYTEEEVYSAVLLWEDLRSLGVKDLQGLEAKFTVSASDKRQYLDVWA